MTTITTPKQVDRTHSAGSTAESFERSLRLFQVHEVGRRIVVSSCTEDIPPASDLEEDRQELQALIDKHDAEEVAFDLSDLRFFSSSFLSLLVCFTQQNLRVAVFNPPDHLVRVLETTRLNRLIHVGRHLT